MATIIDNRITVEFNTSVEDVAVDMSDDGCEIYIEQTGSTVVIPRAEVEQFCDILRNWSAEHPRAAR